MKDVLKDLSQIWTDDKWDYYICKYFSFCEIQLSPLFSLHWLKFKFAKHASSIRNGTSFLINMLYQS